MRNNKILKYILPAFLLAALVVGCIEDNKNEIEGKGPKNIRVYGGPDKLAVADSIVDTLKLADIWRDAINEASLNESVDVQFSLNPALVDAYNEANGTELVALDPAYFDFYPSTLGFDPGVFKQDLNVIMHAAGLDLSKDYAIGLKIDAGTWQGAGDKVIKLALPSQYAGSYHSTGIRYNFNSAGEANTSTWPPTGFVSTGPWDYPSTPAATLSSKVVAVHAANSNGGFGRINLQVNPDNTVTITPNSDIGLANLVQSTHRPSTYDPDTKTFELYYEYTNANGTFRSMRHVLVKNE